MENKSHQLYQLGEVVYAVLEDDCGDKLIEFEIKTIKQAHENADILYDGIPQEHIEQTGEDAIKLFENRKLEGVKERVEALRKYAKENYW